jgi:electron transfer flavoprotein alpha subunit
MSVLIYAETPGGKIKKSTLEAVYFGKKTAEALGTEAVALVVGPAGDLATLGNYGADKVVHISEASLASFDSQVHADVIKQVADAVTADTIIMGHTSAGKSLVGRLAVKMDAGSVTAVNAVPDVSAGFQVTKNVFSGKALATSKITSPNRVITVAGNSLQPQEVAAAGAMVDVSVNVPAARVKVKEVNTVEGTVPLPEAELVVSAGRGMKGPENWGIIDELADALGATTACSRPVADIGWRPHHEHVGQTGVAIKPNLYIAAGISGAIQHLAGVNRSKTIVVINKDPEAPFFKAADYGICADLFDVVPKLTEAIKKYKAAN